MKSSKKVVRSLPALLVSIGLAVSLSQARELTFDERVEAQAAIDRVYYLHQIGAVKPFEEAVPRSVLEEKVRKYLRQSVALEEYWKTPVTAEMLEREMDRMARQTRMPERLRELLAAVGNDVFLVQECLARPALVDRLAHNFFAFDERVHCEGRREAEGLRAAIVAGSIDPAAEHPRRTVSDIVRETSEGNSTGAADAGVLRVELDTEEFGALDWMAGIGPLTDGREAFAVHVLLREESTELRIATFYVAKTSWDEWWSRMQDSFDERRFRSAAIEAHGAPGPDLPASTCVEAWDNRSLDDVPDGRHLHTAVWTGSRMVIWGGRRAVSPLYFNTGWQYDPATDTWIAMSTANAPSARYYHTAVWTGSRMVVWGGFGGGAALRTGGQYDLATDTWTPTSTAGVPSSRQGHTAVWTDSKMVVWGGIGGTALNTGGQYDPAMDTWTPTSTASAPSGRYFHTAVWTGSRMVVWGGYGGTSLDTGGRYDPVTDTWLPTSTGSAPSGRGYQTAVWTGSRMVVWGGYDGSANLNTGGRYDPVTDTWLPTSVAGAPSSRSFQTAVWTGSRMVVWGGNGGSMFPHLNTGGHYDPSTDTWSSTSTTGAPSGRYYHTAVWTGSRMVVWGGYRGVSTNTGGRYDLATNTWTPTSTGNAPSARSNHTAIWTGSRMVVWGGYGGTSLKTGGQYDPAIDTWTDTSTPNAPVARYGHTAVWTGSKMVVWGGRDDSSYFYTGSQYDPATNSWSHTTTTGAPSARVNHTAVWTGSRMVVWGGFDRSSVVSITNTGGRYDPEADTWTPTSTASAPSARFRHTAVWTGSRMVVWGGTDNFDTSTVTNTGGQYDPATNSWSPTSTTGTPSARDLHTAVWAGNKMIVWGGCCDNTGGQYDPATNTWIPTATAGAPSARYHRAVWTGTRMVVWGGTEGTTPVNTGRQYDPVADDWIPMSTAGAPSARANHTAIWAASRMVIWGGSDGENDLESGGMWISDSPPGETFGLRFPSPPTDEETMEWDPIPNATRYDVVRGDLAALPVGPSGDDEVCFDDLPSAMVVDSTVLAGGFFYVVRGENDCGSGPWGNTHVNPGPPLNGPPRTTATCP